MQKPILAFGLSLAVFAALADQQRNSSIDHHPETTNQSLYLTISNESTIDNMSGYLSFYPKMVNLTTRRERNGRSKGFLLIPSKETRSLPKLFLTAGVATQTKLKGGGGGGGWGQQQGGGGGGGWGQQQGGGGGWGPQQGGGGGWGQQGGGGGGWGGGGNVGWGQQGGGGGGGWGWGPPPAPGWGSGGGGGGGGGGWGWAPQCPGKKAVKAAAKAQLKQMKALKKAQKKLAKGGGWSGGGGGGGWGGNQGGGGGWGGGGGGGGKKGGGGGGWGGGGNQGGGGGGWGQQQGGGGGWGQQGGGGGGGKGGGWRAEVDGPPPNEQPAPPPPQLPITELSQEDDEWPDAASVVSNARVHDSFEENDDYMSEPRTFDMLEEPLPILLSYDAVHPLPVTRYARSSPAESSVGSKYQIVTKTKVKNKPKKDLFKSANKVITSPPTTTERGKVVYES